MKKENDMRFKKTLVKPNGEIKFDAALLEIYLAIDENKNIYSLYEEMGLPPAVFKQAVIKLLKLKLIAHVEEETVTANRFFLNRMREVAIELSGPVGALLIEDAARGMDFDHSRMADTQKADLIYKIAAAIPSFKQATEFKKIMLREIVNHGKAVAHS